MKTQTTPRFAQVKFKDQIMIIPFMNVEMFRGQNYHTISEATEEVFKKQCLAFNLHDELVKELEIATVDLLRAPPHIRNRWINLLKRAKGEL